MTGAGEDGEEHGGRCQGKRTGATEDGVKRERGDERS